MNRKELFESYNNALETNKGFMVAFISLPDMETCERIVNTSENFEEKVKYYLKAYDKNMVHKHNPDIRIDRIEFFDDVDFFNYEIL